MAKTEHSKNFTKVKNYYNSYYNGRRMWTQKMVYNAVGKWITADEYKDITGEEYKETK